MKNALGFLGALLITTTLHAATIRGIIRDESGAPLPGVTVYEKGVGSISAFLRIHRSAIIRADRIWEVKGEGSARLRVVLDDGTELIVSRSRAGQLKRWMI